MSETQGATFAFVNGRTKDTVSLPPMRENVVVNGVQSVQVRPVDPVVFEGGVYIARTNEEAERLRAAPGFGTLFVEVSNLEEARSLQPGGDYASLQSKKAALQAQLAEVERAEAALNARQGVTPETPSAPPTAHGVDEATQGEQPGATGDGGATTYAGITRAGEAAETLITAHGVDEATLRNPANGQFSKVLIHEAAAKAGVAFPDLAKPDAD